MTEFVGRNAVANCARCGRRRQLGKNKTDLCVDCLYVEPGWPESVETDPLESHGCETMETAPTESALTPQPGPDHLSFATDERG